MALALHAARHEEGSIVARQSRPGIATVAYEVIDGLAMFQVSPYAEVEPRPTATDAEGPTDREIITIHVYGVQG